MKNAMRIILVILLVLTVTPMMGCTSTIRMTGYTNPTYQAEPDKPLPELEPVEPDEPLPEPEPAEPAEPVEPEPSPKLEPTPEPTPTPEPNEPLGDPDAFFLLGTGVCMPEPQCWYSYKPTSAEVTQRADLARYLKEIDSGEWDGSPEYREGWKEDDPEYMKAYGDAYAVVKDGILKVGHLGVVLKQRLRGAPTTEEVVAAYNNGEWGTPDSFEFHRPGIGVFDSNGEEAVRIDEHSPSPLIPTWPTVWSEDGQTEWRVGNGFYLSRYDFDGQELCACWYREIAVVGAKPVDCDMLNTELLSRLVLDGRWDGSPIFNEEGWVAEYTPSTGIILTNSKKCIRHYTGVYPALKDLDVGWRCVAYDDESGLTIALTADGTIGVYRPDGSNIAQAKCACCDDTHKCVAYSPGHEILVYAGGDIVYKVDIFADGATITPRYENVVDVVSFGEYLPETRFPDYYCASEAIKRITYRGEDSKLHTVNWDGK